MKLAFCIVITICFQFNIGYSQSSLNSSDSNVIQSNFLNVVKYQHSYEVIGCSYSINLSRGGFFQDKILYATDSILIIEKWIPQEYNCLSFFHVFHLYKDNEITYRKFTNFTLADSNMRLTPIYLEFENDTCIFEYGMQRKKLEYHAVGTLLLDRFKYYLREV